MNSFVSIAISLMIAFTFNFALTKKSAGRNFGLRFFFSLDLYDILKWM